MDFTTLFNTILALVLIAGFLISAMIMSGILSDKETRTAWMSEVEDNEEKVWEREEEILTSDPIYSFLPQNIYNKISER